MNSRRTRLRSALAVILTVLVLVPTAVLFARVWQENSDQRSQTELEQMGVDYLTALASLVNALAEAQSSAVQGDNDPPDSLATAVTRVSAVDSTLGAELRTTERWADLRSRIEKLGSVSGGAIPVFQSYTEVTDLTLALYQAVRRNSQLSRDADSDISNLQQAAAVDMPATMIRVSRMGDYATILQDATGNTRDAVALQFGQEVLAVQALVNALTESLQAAADETNSPTLSGNLVNTLDSFRRGVETMTRGANQGGNPNAGTIATAQTALQGSLTALSGVLVREMATLLDDRNDSLSYRRIEAIVAAILVLLLVVGAATWPSVARRRLEDEAMDRAEPTREVPGGHGVPPARPGYGQYDLPPNYGDSDPTRRERSGALR